MIPYKPLVIIESPYAGDVERNLRYLRACLKHSLQLGEAPFASHAIYTQPGVLDDLNPAQRQQGIEAGFAWWDAAQRIVFYVDLGWSNGMLAASERARELGKPMETRRIAGAWWEP